MQKSSPIPARELTERAQAPRAAKPGWPVLKDILQRTILSNANKRHGSTQQDINHLQ